MRRTLLAAISTVVLGAGMLLPPAAHSAAASYVVLGHPITAAPGLSLIGDGCSATDFTPTVTTLERQDGTVGGSSLGYSVNQANYEAGPVATIAGDPSTINTAEIDVFAPTGTSGNAYAKFAVAGTNDYYVGFRAIAIPANQWIHNNLVNVAYSWDKYTNGIYQSTTSNTHTIQEWAANAGATTAQLGVLLGCGGEQFFVDRLLLGNAANSVSYDFEAAPTVTPTPTPTPTPAPTPAPLGYGAVLDWSTDGKTVHRTSRVVLRYGQSLWTLGAGYRYSDTESFWCTGMGNLKAQPTKGVAKVVGHKGFDLETYAAYRLAPTQETTYRFTADAVDGQPAAESNYLKVQVRSKARATVADQHLVQGQRLAVAGQVLPKVKGVKVILQRHLAGHWTNLTDSKTSKAGKFSLAVTARTKGTWEVRVLVKSTVKNLGTKTKSAKVQVDRYVPPSQDSTPAITAQVATPQPTQVTTTEPTPPPDRVTDSGRLSLAGNTELVEAVAGEQGPAKP